MESMQKKYREDIVPAMMKTFTGLVPACSAEAGDAVPTSTTAAMQDNARKTTVVWFMMISWMGRRLGNIIQRRTENVF